MTEKAKFCPNESKSLQPFGIIMNDLLKDFFAIAPIAGIEPAALRLEVHDLGCPHRKPKSLPPDKMGIYVFIFGDQVLKVGKVGPKSGPRWTSQHYLPKSALSTLAGSLTSDQTSAYHQQLQENQLEVGDWMMSNLQRINILLDADAGEATLAFLEAFLHCRLNPKYEGRNRAA